ncbi:MAG TPA: BrnT family toxin [Syntrophobacteria bacterium]|nr:BrnT family toxin [Syntrophobacteria bacterium]
MGFQFDERKSQSNKGKHGIDFVEAQKLWHDPDRIEVAARTVDEPRFLMVGKIGNDHWSAVFTYRNEITRIISVRRSRQEEIELYEGE